MKRIMAALLIFIAATFSLYADEGMWLLNQPPRDLVREKYGFDLSDEWLRRAQLSTVRFGTGSGGFVSPDGLVITNHHVGSDCLLKLSPKGQDYYENGYTAKSQQEELKCPALELNVLQSIEDVTARVEAAVTPAMAAEEAAAARRKVMAEIEKASLDATGLRSDIVTLYQGGLYHLYRYKKYTDVRLVFAPEHSAASFGGDVDNFEFPRYNLDICFFRVYENGKPHRPLHYLRWNASGPSDGDLVFVIGFPGATSRLETLANLLFRRDVLLPHQLSLLRQREALLLQFSALGREQKKIAANDLYRSSNARKRESGSYQGLLNAALIEARGRAEEELQARVKADPKLHSDFGAAWQNVTAALDIARVTYVEYDLLERGGAFDSTLFTIARYLVRMSAEKTKPGPERLREYRDSNLESLELFLFSPAPIYRDLEKAKLAGSMMFLAEKFGGDHPVVKMVLEGKTPTDRAAELIDGTTLVDPENRRKLAAQGEQGIKQSNDSLIKLARSVDEHARNIRKRYEAEVEEPLRQAYSQIARARFAIYGTAQPPDATGTLRLSLGVVKGYQEEGKEVPFFTTVEGLLAHAREHENHEPFTLSERWIKAEGISPATRLNFVSTADTIGGSSGSPVLNRKGEFVGINFDRNRQGIIRTFLYTEEGARHIAVHSGGIAEALRHVYGADRVLQEILPK